MPTATHVRHRPHVVARPARTRNGRVALTFLQDGIAGLLDSQSVPLPWQRQIALMSAPTLRAALAGRADIAPDVLDLLARDTHSTVRFAAVGNPALPLERATRLAGSVQPYGALALAARPDCPDEQGAAAITSAAATLVATTRQALAAATGNDEFPDEALPRVRMSARRWNNALNKCAAGMVGKPAAQRAVIAVCEVLAAESGTSAVPAALLRVCTADVQTGVLEALCAQTPLPIGRLNTTLWALRGTDAQRQLVREAAARWQASQPENSSWTKQVFTTLTCWADPPSPQRVRAMSDEQYHQVSNAVHAIGEAADSPDRLEVALAAICRDEMLTFVLGANPHVDVAWANTILSRTHPGMQVPPEGVDEPLSDCHWAGDEAGSDPLHRAPRRVALAQERVLEALTPLLGTQAWPLLEQMWGPYTPTSVGALILAAAVASDVDVPAGVLAACAGAPAADPAERGNDEPPF